MQQNEPQGAETAVEPEVWIKSRVFEEFEVGQVYDHHWGRTLNAGDNTLFSTATVALLPLHLNDAYAQELGHPADPVNPMLVFSTVFGLSVEDLSEGRGGGAFLGVDDLEFLQPVYPGDTVTGRSTVAATRSSSSRPTQGIVTWKTEGRNQHGDLVVTFTRTNLIMRREA